MKVHAHALRVLHKWIGLLIGLQLLLWTLSGTVMALLPMEKVAGGPKREERQAGLNLGRGAWDKVLGELGSSPISGLSVRRLLDRPVYEVTTPAGVKLFDAVTGEPLAIDSGLARRIAGAAYLGHVPVRSVTPLKELSLEVREHQLPIWRVDFADERNSSYYVSGSTGALLERRDDSWRTWDFFWMLHIMDYGNRTSFNHPLIITLGFAAVWLAVTGFWLLFRTGWRSDFKHLRARPRAHRAVDPVRRTRNSG